MFHKSFTPILLVFYAMQYKIGKMVAVEPPLGPVLQRYFESCGFGGGNPLHFVECYGVSFFTELLPNVMGQMFFTMLVITIAVLSTHLYIRCGQHGKSPVFSPNVITIMWLFGNLLGAGIICPAILPTLFVLAKMFEPPHAPNPAPPSYAYTATTLATQFLVFLLELTLTFLPLTNSHWFHVLCVFMGHPLVFLPLALFPKDIQCNYKAGVPTLSASAFGFLRDACAPLWWITVVGSAALYQAGIPFSVTCHITALDFTALVLGTVGLYTVEYAAGDAPSGLGPIRMLGGLALMGPASTMAAYFEAKEKESIRFAQESQKRGLGKV